MPTTRVHKFRLVWLVLLAFVLSLTLAMRAQSHLNEHVMTRGQVEEEMIEDIVLGGLTYAWDCEPNTYGFTDPPTAPVRFSGEFEPRTGIYVGWPSTGCLFPELTDVIRIGLAQEIEMLLLTADPVAVRNCLRARGIPNEQNVRMRSDTMPIDTIWGHDYLAAVTISSENPDMDSRHGIDMSYFPMIWPSCQRRGRYNDDAAPTRLARGAIYNNVYRPQFRHEGSNLQTDGNGTCFMSTRALTYNQWSRWWYERGDLERIHQQYFGCNRVVLLESLAGEVLQHIDMWMTVISPNTIIVNRYDDPTDPHPEIERNVNLLTSLGYRVVRIPAPKKYCILRNPGCPGTPAAIRMCAEPNTERVWATYANSIRIGNSMAVPVYRWVPEQLRADIEAQEAEALATYARELPGVEIIPVTADFMIPCGSAIHSIAMPYPGPLGLGCAQKLEILAPIPGEILSSQELGFITARLQPLQDNVIIDAQIFAERDDGTMFPIDQGDLRSFASPDLITALWDLDDVPSGDYVIHVNVHPGGMCPQLSATVPVTVNRAPELVDMPLLACQAGPKGTQVTLQAVTTDAENDPVATFIWDAGDGDEPQLVLDSNQFTHTYAPDVSTVVILVTAYDRRGGMLQQARDLDVQTCSLRTTTDCGCSEMWIFSVHGLNSFIYCAAAVPTNVTGCAVDPDAPPGSCPQGQTAFRCPLGPVSPAGPIVDNFLGWTFEVLADLDPTTNDITRCDQGQFNRGTASRTPTGRAAADLISPKARRKPTPGNYNFPGGGDFTVVGPTREDPDVVYPKFAGPNYGADNYTAPLTLGRRFGDRFYWLDAARFPVDQQSHSAATQREEFVTYVRGNLGTCWCQFRIEHAWTPAGGRTAIGGGAAPTQVNIVAGRNCRP